MNGYMIAKTKGYQHQGISKGYQRGKQSSNTRDSSKESLSDTRGYRFRRLKSLEGAYYLPDGGKWTRTSHLQKKRDLQCGPSF